MYRIWEESTIFNVDNDHVNLISSHVVGKYVNYEDASEALEKLAESKFNFSKYRTKKMISKKRIDNDEYEVTYQTRYLIKTRYFIHPKKS